MLQDTPMQSVSSFKLWSTLRPPLLRFLCRHLKESAHYFLSMDDARLFKPDYFWLLYDLALHPAGTELLDAVCASVVLWEAILDHLIRDIGGPVAKQADDSTFRVLQLMAAIVERRPAWVSEQPALWPKVQALWQVPARAARLAAVPGAGTCESGESAMIARLMLSHIDHRRGELWRICDLFSILSHRVRSRVPFRWRGLPMQSPIAYAGTVGVTIRFAQATIGHQMRAIARLACMSFLPWIQLLVQMAGAVAAKAMHAMVPVCAPGRDECHGPGRATG